MYVVFQSARNKMIARVVMVMNDTKHYMLCRQCTHHTNSTNVRVHLYIEDTPVVRKQPCNDLGYLIVHVHDISLIALACWCGNSLLNLSSLIPSLA